MPVNSAVLPTTQTRGDHEEMCLAAGAGVAAVRSIEPAEQIVQGLMTDAWELMTSDGPRSLNHFIPPGPFCTTAEIGDKNMT
jgi:hypothetical protein